MSQIILTAPAKINLSLDVVGKRQDGYHLLRTVMQSIDLADRVTINLSNNDQKSNQIHVTTRQNQILPLDQQNTAWKAAFVFLNEHKKRIAEGFSIQIVLDKRIPVAAGLAGGSADAAAVLVGLNELFHTRLTRDQLDQMAVQIGADVPFTIHGGTILCEGIGEVLTPLPAWDRIPVLLCCPDEKCLTAQVFSDYDQREILQRPQTEQVVMAVENRDLKQLASATANVLEPVSMTAKPVLRTIKRALKNHGAVLAQMSGSGPSVFGLFETLAECQSAYELLQREMSDSIRLTICQTTSSGPKVINHVK